MFVYIILCIEILVFRQINFPNWLNLRHDMRELFLLHFLCVSEIELKIFFLKNVWEEIFKLSKKKNKDQTLIFDVENFPLYSCWKLL